jgi:D-alanyl-D-alanine carboxypeptidase
VASRLQQTLDRVRASLSIPGVSAAITWDDGRTWVGASGMRDVAAGDPMTTDTAFALASISKTLTAAVVMELVQEGRLSLDQPVSPLLPRFRLDARITVRMLLDHTSGLPDFFFGKGIDKALQAKPNASWTALQAWAYVPAAHGVPGKVWIYSNTNYLLLGELVRAVTGRPLATEVRTRLLDPLGLSSAYYQAVEHPKEAGTVAYLMLAKTGGGWTVRPVAPASGVMPFRSVVTAAGGAGSVAATALDAARWMRAWAAGLVLDPGTQALVLGDIARTVRLHAAIPYGLGIQRVTLNGYLAYGHSGRYVGIRNVVRYLPDAGVTIAVLTNQSAWDPTRIASALLKVVLPTPAPSASPGTSGQGPTPWPSPTPSPS